MSSKKRKRVSKPTELKEKSSEIREETPVSEPVEENNNTSEWLVLKTMQGTEIRCARCRSQIEFNKGSLTHALLKNKYCYNCGAEMIMKEI